MRSWMKMKPKIQKKEEKMSVKHFKNTVKTCIWWQWGQWLWHSASLLKLKPVPLASLSSEVKIRVRFCHPYFPQLLWDLHLVSSPASCFQVPQVSCSFTNRCFLTPCRWLLSCPPRSLIQFQHMPKSEQLCRDNILYFKIKYWDFLVAFGL